MVDHLTTQDLRVTRGDRKEVYHVITKLIPNTDLKGPMQDEQGLSNQCQLGRQHLNDEFVLAVSIGNKSQTQIQILAIHRQGEKIYVAPVSEKRDFDVSSLVPTASCFQGFSFNYRGPKDMTLVAAQPDATMIQQLATDANEASSVEYVQANW